MNSPAIMPRKMPVIDTHAHFFDAMRGEGIVWPAPVAPYYGRKRVEEYDAEITLGGLGGVIAVETSRRGCDDAYLREICRNHESVAGYIANLAPDTAQFEQRLAEYCLDDGFKGVRLRPVDRYNLLSADVAAICEAVADRGKLIELGTKSPKRLLELFMLARAVPHARFVLVHVGHPLTESGQLNADWEAALQINAPPENIWCKVTTGFGTALNAEAAQKAAIELPLVVRRIKATFSPDRLLWGSNWPVAGPAQIRELLDVAKTELGQETARMALLDNAAELYALDGAKGYA